MATFTITGLTAVLAGNLTDAALFAVDDSTGATRKATMAQVRTQIGTTTSFKVGPNGATNPTLFVDGSTASAATGLKIKSAAAGSGVAISVITSGTNENLTIDAAGSGTITIGSVSTGAITLTRATTFTNGLITTTVAASSSVLSSGATAGMGYSTGAGGTVTQLTSKSTGVTLSRVCGQITMNGAALAAATIVSFVLTNTAIAATDLLILNHVATGTFGAYGLNARCAAGSATIDVRNNTAGSLSEAIVIGFAIQKAVTA